MHTHTHKHTRAHAHACMHAHVLRLQSWAYKGVQKEKAGNCSAERRGEKTSRRQKWRWTPCLVLILAWHTLNNLMHGGACMAVQTLWGIDLATPHGKQETTHDLDHIMLDAMLEGFDTGVSCWKTTGFLCALCIEHINMHGAIFEADSARHVVSMGQLFSRLRTPCGGHLSTCFNLLTGFSKMIVWLQVRQKQTAEQNEELVIPNKLVAQSSQAHL